MSHRCEPNLAEGPELIGFGFEVVEVGSEALEGRLEIVDHALGEVEHDGIGRCLEIWAVANSVDLLFQSPEFEMDRLQIGRPVGCCGLDGAELVSGLFADGGIGFVGRGRAPRCFNFNHALVGRRILLRLCLGRRRSLMIVESVHVPANECETDQHDDAADQIEWQSASELRAS